MYEWRGDKKLAGMVNGFETSWLGIEVVKNGFVIFSVADFQLRYRLLDEDLTLLQAIGYAGDINSYGKKKEILRILYY